MHRLSVFLLPALLMGAQARYARLGEFDGKVEVQLRAADPWTAAQRNLPLTESAWVRTGEASRAEIELDDGTVWRMGPNSQVELADYTRLSTGQRITLLSLDSGVAYCTGHAEGKDTLMLVVPGAEVTMAKPAKVRLEVVDQWSQISVLDGTARFSSPAAELDLSVGQYTRVEPANPSRFFLDRKPPPLELDRWSAERDKLLASPGSAGHVVQRYGLQDLDAAGVWIQTADLGAVWRPKEQTNWKPFQNGSWRWYPALGYTWVSADPWGWLPYHYGRWTRRENQGWVWAPGDSPVFKPGDVYWLLGKTIVGWGPLAPGENFRPGEPGVPSPVQYLEANTTFAEYPGNGGLPISKFVPPPKEPLKVADFVSALPSPAFLPDTLEATRPLLQAGNTRLTPMVEGVTNQTARMAPMVMIEPAPVMPPPRMVVRPSAPNAPTAAQDPQIAEVPVPVPYPVAVYTGLATSGNSGGAPPRSSKTTAQNSNSKPPSGPAVNSYNGRATSSRPPDRQPHEKRFRRGEAEIAADVVKLVEKRAFPEALILLDNWSYRFPDSDFQADRLYYYIVAYDGMGKPSQTVAQATHLLASNAQNSLEDPRQLILALYLTSLNIQSLPHPTREEYSTGQTAARNLLEFVPVYCTPQNKPASASEADWRKTRTVLEDTAKTTLTVLGQRAPR